MRTEVVSLGRRNIQMADGMANAEEVYNAICDRLERGDIPVRDRHGHLLGFIKEAVFRDGEVFVKIQLLQGGSHVGAEDSGTPGTMVQE